MWLTPVCFPTVERQENFSYVEAVLGCQSFVNQVCCAGGALEAHKPELLEQTKPERRVVTSKQFVFLSNVRNCFPMVSLFFKD